MVMTRGPRGVRGRIAALVAGVALVLTGVVAQPTMATPGADTLGRAFALSGSSFQAGYIIDDANFYQPGAMSQSQIQAFLESKVTCTNSNCLALLYTKSENRAADRTICSAYTTDSDGIERASTIIYKVQQICGISARVLLVTLQKEQGLILKSAPTTGELRAAMGYRCPDTSPCSTDSAGFFRQIYGAAWQFKRYNTPDLWGNYHIGTYSIRYSTDSSCGSKTVTIRNHATAALYNYTPYTPNVGALTNLYTTAPCGSYGNRNFWVVYSTWFGSPLAGAGEAAITAAYTAFGGATSTLGVLTSTGACGLKSVTCHKTYEHGVIYWSAASGTFIVAGVFGDYYLALGGPSSPLGVPTRNAVAVSGGANGDGFNQPFTGGLISSSVNGTFALRGTFRTTHAAMGGVAGSMGWPVSERVCTSAGCKQQFQHGWIMAPDTATASVTVSNPDIVAYYDSLLGTPAQLGIAKINAVPMVGGANGDGFNQPFVGGLISSSANGTFSLRGAIRTEHGSLGGIAGPLGWPLADQVCGLAGEVCSQDFQHGTIYASATAVGETMYQPITDYYLAHNGPAGFLGIPRREPVAMAGGGNGPGYNQPFTGGLVSSSAEGTFSLVGGIRKTHGTFGGVAGVLGWPTADQVCGLANNGCSQQFQHGSITVDITGTKVLLF
ncbi:MAG TPA: hypothetical protein VF479_04210 [Pseudolysinimonas sp.]